MQLPTFPGVNTRGAWIELVNCVQTAVLCGTHVAVVSVAPHCEAT
jgi:hypothetical protein